MLNKVELIGRVGQEVEVKRLDSGSVVASFSVATTENYKDKSGEWQSQTEWHKITAWGSLAEKAERRLKKGSLVFVEGKLTSRKYTDKNGIERTSTEVVISGLIPLEKSEGQAQSQDVALTEAQSAVLNSAATDDLPF